MLHGLVANLAHLTGTQLVFALWASSIGTAGFTDAAVQQVALSVRDTSITGIVPIHHRRMYPGGAVQRPRQPASYYGAVELSPELAPVCGRYQFYAGDLCGDAPTAPRDVQERLWLRGCLRERPADQDEWRPGQPAAAAVGQHYLCPRRTLCIATHQTVSAQDPSWQVSHVACLPRVTSFQRRLYKVKDLWYKRGSWAIPGDRHVGDDPRTGVGNKYSTVVPVDGDGWQAAALIEAQYDSGDSHGNDHGHDHESGGGKMQVADFVGRKSSTGEIVCASPDTPPTATTTSPSSAPAAVVCSPAKAGPGTLRAGDVIEFTILLTELTIPAVLSIDLLPMSRAKG